MTIIIHWLVHLVDGRNAHGYLVYRAIRPRWSAKLHFSIASTALAPCRQQKSFSYDQIDIDDRSCMGNIEARPNLKKWVFFFIVLSWLFPKALFESSDCWRGFFSPFCLTLGLKELLENIVRFFSIYWYCRTVVKNLGTSPEFPSFCEFLC